MTATAARPAACLAAGVVVRLPDTRTLPCPQTPARRPDASRTFSAAAQTLGNDYAVPRVAEVNAAIEPLLHRDRRPRQARATRRRQQLVAGPLETDRVIVGHDPRKLGRQHRVQVQAGRHPAPRGSWVGRCAAEATAVTRDELRVEVLRGAAGVADLVPPQLGDEPILKAAIEPFAAAAGLGAVGEDQADLQLAHGLLEVRRLAVRIVQGRQAAVARGDELAGAVQVEGARQAVADEDVVADGEAAVAILLGLELAPQRLAGSVVAAKQQAAGRALGAEPGMGAAIEEEQFAFTGTACAAATMLAAAQGPTVAQWSQPATQRLVGKEDVVLLSEDVGEVGEVEVRVGGGGQVEDLLSDGVGGLVGRRPCRVAVAEGLRAFSLEAVFEALDLSSREAQGAGGLIGGKPPFEEGLAGFGSVAPGPR